MTEIEAIKARHSVRSYSDRKIDAETQAKINGFIDKLNEEGSLHLQFIADAGKTYSKLFNKVMGLGSAPSVIACIGNDDDTLEERVGYYGEKLVLFLQQLGLNTCWTGMFNRDKIPVELNVGEVLVLCIAVGYGTTQGKVRKSKTVGQVSSAAGNRPSWFDFGVEMALLAPTAINQQQFEIRLDENESVSFVDKGGVFSKVDLGIVKYHFEVGVAYAKNN